MKQVIIDESCRLVRANREICFPDSDQPYFDESLVGFTSSDDSLFLQYKTAIESFQLTSQELITQSLGADSWQPTTVIC